MCNARRPPGHGICNSGSSKASRQEEPFSPRALVCGHKQAGAYSRGSAAAAARELPRRFVYLFIFYLFIYLFI